MKLAFPALILAAGAFALASCEREPRSQSFFETHEAERIQVLADCKNGTHTGQECQLAQLAADKVTVTQRH